MTVEHDVTASMGAFSFSKLLYEQNTQRILGFKHFTRDIFEQVYNRRHVCLIFKNVGLDWSNF